MLFRLHREVFWVRTDVFFVLFPPQRPGVRRQWGERPVPASPPGGSWQLPTASPCGLLLSPTLATLATARVLVNSPLPNFPPLLGVSPSTSPAPSQGLLSELLIASAALVLVVRNVPGFEQGCSHTRAQGTLMHATCTHPQCSLICTSSCMHTPTTLTCTSSCTHTHMLTPCTIHACTCSYMRTHRHAHTHTCSPTFMHAHTHARGCPRMWVWNERLGQDAPKPGVLRSWCRGPGGPSVEGHRAAALGRKCQ